MPSTDTHPLCKYNSTFDSPGHQIKTIDFPRGAFNSHYFDSLLNNSTQFPRLIRLKYIAPEWLLSEPWGTSLVMEFNTLPPMSLPMGGNVLLTLLPPFLLLTLTHKNGFHGAQSGVLLLHDVNYFFYIASWHPFSVFHHASPLSLSFSLFSLAYLVSLSLSLKLHEREDWDQGRGCVFSQYSVVVASVAPLPDRTALALSIWVTLGKLHNLFAPWFLHVQNRGYSHTCFVGWLWRLNKLIELKDIEKQKLGIW